MPFDETTAVPVTPEFDAASAEPVKTQDAAKAPNPFALNEAEFRAASPLGRLKMMLEHPWDKYVASVDQGFKGVQIPRVEADQGTDVVSRAGQVGAATTNTLTGAAGGMLSPGGAAAVLTPPSLIYSAPRFLVGGIENIIDVVKGAKDEPFQETVEKGLGGALMVAGGAHVVKGAPRAVGLSSPEAPKTPAEAADIIKAQVEKTTDPEAKAALEAAATRINERAAQGVKFDPDTATPVEEPVSTETAPAFDEQTAQPVEVSGEHENKTVTDFSGEGDGNTHGIAARVSEARAQVGRIEPIEPGTGISAEESVAQGRAALKAGADPQVALDEFNQTGRISAEQISLVRAQGEKLAKAASDAAEQHGIDSPEYRTAADLDSAWTKAIKPMQTEWHRIGQAQQGEVEIDTGTFHGLRRGYQELTGNDFTPEQADAAQRIASGVKESNNEVVAATAKLSDALKNSIPEAVAKKGLGLSEAIKDAAQAARQRIRERLTSGRVSSGLDPEDVADHAIVGTEYIAKGIDTFTEWSKEMLNEFGERIRPHLKAIFDRAQENAKTAAPESTPTSVADVWKRAKDYLDAGETDFDDIRHKIATDTGLSVEEVTRKLAEPKAMRKITDELYTKMAARRQLTNSAKSWLREQATPGWLRFAKSVPSFFFKLATFGHGTVGMVTHAGLNAFDPVVLKPYWQNFFRQFKLLGLHDQGAFHERMMQDLVRDPNFATARRAGLANDPVKYLDDYQSGWLTGYFRRIGLTGNRGFDALKLYRQDRFNQIWDSLPRSLKTTDMAKLVADGINHSTGVVKQRFGEWSNWTFFAPKLEGSRWAWLIGDPLKASKIIAHWKDATEAEKQFALREIRQKATITGIYFSMLAANQGLLDASGSKQQINFTDPRRSDFLAFKAGDHNFGIVTPLLGVVRLMANLLHAAVGKRSKFEAQTSRADQMAETAGQYARGKLSPFGGLVADVATQSDFQKRPLPFSSDKIPHYLAQQGIKKYTYAEYLAEHTAPIPVEEAVREVWRKQGVSESDIEHWAKALTSAAIMGGTGARMTPDNHEGKPAK